MSETETTTERVGPTPGPWYVGSQSDILSVITKPPRPSTDDINPKQDCDWIADINFRLPGERANANLIAAAPDLQAVAKAYEQWEADLILSQEAWRGGAAELPTLTWPLWDRLLEIQAMRNAALAKAAGPKEAAGA